MSATPNPIEGCKALLEQAAQSVIDEGEKYWASKRADKKRPVEAIFHYTSAQNALQILQSGELWFTELAHLNDPSEIQFGMEVAEAAAKELGLLVIADWLKFLQTRFTTPHGYYVASFSIDGDSLPQWRAYADDGKGIALGFSLSAFDKDHPDYKVLNGTPTTFAVRYDVARLKYFQKRLITLSRDLSNNAEIQTYLALYIILNSLQFKHPAYKHEQEFRALILGDRSRIAESSLHQLRERKGQWVEYLKRPIYPTIKQPGTLRLIRVGPAAPVELVEQVKNALLSLGIPLCVIDKSTIPYTSYIN